MKKLFLLVGMGLVVMSFSLLQGGMDTIVRSFKSGDAEEVAKHFDEYVDIKLLDKDEVKNMGRNQAGLALKSFYSENGIKGFEKLSDREIGSTMYMTGKLLANQKTFNITVLMKQMSGQYKIITVRIN